MAGRHDQLTRLTGPCQRCGDPTISTIYSMFNTQMICFPCKTLEEAHPGYAEAVQVEREHVQHGDYNFPGIGLPADQWGTDERTRVE